MDSKSMIEATKKAIKTQEDLELGINARLSGLRNQIVDEERELFKVKNIKESLEAALEKLEEAKERWEGS